MNTYLSRKQTVSIFAADGKCSAFDSRFLSGLFVDEFGLEPPAFCPAQVHPQEHLRPVLSVCSAGTGVYCHDSVALIIWSGEHHLRLGLFDFAFKPFDRNL